MNWGSTFGDAPKRGKNWMQKAVKKPGSFTAWCKRQGFSGVTSACIAKGKRSKNATTRKRANLAQTFRKTAKKRKRRK